VRFYFSGDTGYRYVAEGIEPLSREEAAAPACPAFQAIGARYGPVHLAGLPIGAYSPRFFMSSFHASPEDAVAMHAAVRVVGRSVGMHWGAFPLTDEPIEEPPRRLQSACTRAGLAPGAFVAVRPGAIVGARAGTLNAAHVVAGGIVEARNDAELAASGAGPELRVGPAGAASPAEFSQQQPPTRTVEIPNVF